MGFPGIILILSAAAVSGVSEAIVRGKIGVNHLVGLRVGYVTHSDEAWLSGHRAARPLLHASGAVLAAAGALLLVPGMPETGGAIIGVTACLIMLGLIIAASVKASRAAEVTVVKTVDAQAQA